MEIFTNIPCISIVLCLMSGVICSVLNWKAARIWTYTVNFLLACASFAVLIYTISTGEAFVFRMGHFSAPWGNEIRAGILEAMLAMFFSIIMLFSLLAGSKHIEADVKESKRKYYYTLVNLMMSSLLALVYTNDIFTGYVFVEINTISACGLVAIKDDGQSVVASAKYMIMSLLGSGTFLISICLLYDITGHLLMSDIKRAVGELIATGQYVEPFTMIISLMTIGLAIKSALFPFHAWLPDAHTASTISSSSILSSLVLKAYIVLLIKIFYRAIGWENILEAGINNIIFVVGIAAMIMGSVFAAAQKDVKRMVAYSSVAQIGYIFMGFGIGTTAGVIASLFHIFTHGAAKSMIFISLGGIKDVSHHSTLFKDIKGAGFRNKAAGIAFSVGAFSMIGIPLFPGFISKINYAQAAIEVGHGKMVLILVTLALSTILNCLYFFHALIDLYTPTDIDEYETLDMYGEREENPGFIKARPLYISAICGFILLNFFIGIKCDLVLDLLSKGLGMFG